MRILVQRVSRASVTADGALCGAIGHGLLLLVGVRAADGDDDIEWLVRKVANLRIFEGASGVMNHSLLDTAGEALAVSQFTLYASTQKGNRPSYSSAAPGPVAAPIFDRFVARLSATLGRPVPTGKFGAMMDVSLVNSGPVTIWLDSTARE